MVDRDALVIGDALPDWKSDRAGQITRAVSHILVDMNFDSIKRTDMESDRAARYVIKLKGVEADGGEVRVDIRVG